MKTTQHFVIDDVAFIIEKQSDASHLSQSASDTAKTSIPNLESWLKQDTPEIGLSETESFTQWLDARGDSLAPADSFETWLKEREDSL
jgi:hypothetical protein